ncbi:hypothetical protein ABDJ74_000846 [Salmonella enterica]
MNKKFDITEETYMGYGFKRQELTDFFHSKGKHVDLGVPPMSFEDSSDLDGALTLNDALASTQRKFTVVPQRKNKPGKFLRLHWRW